MLYLSRPFRALAKLLITHSSQLVANFQLSAQKVTRDLRRHRGDVFTGYRIPKVCCPLTVVRCPKKKFRVLRSEFRVLKTP